MFRRAPPSYALVRLRSTLFGSSSAVLHPPRLQFCRASPSSAPILLCSNPLLLQPSSSPVYQHSRPPLLHLK
ncbi:hypothetical protein S83_016096, partial [Arachis hypogaea]